LNNAFKATDNERITLEKATDALFESGSHDEAKRMLEQSLQKRRIEQSTMDGFHSDADDVDRFKLADRQTMTEKARSTGGRVLKALPSRRNLPAGLRNRLSSSSSSSINKGLLDEETHAAEANIDTFETTSGFEFMQDDDDNFKYMQDDVDDGPRDKTKFAFDNPLKQFRENRKRKASKHKSKTD